VAEKAGRKARKGGAESAKESSVNSMSKWGKSSTQSAQRRRKERKGRLGEFCDLVGKKQDAKRAKEGRRTQSKSQRSVFVWGETAVFVPPPVDDMYDALDKLENFIHQPSDLPVLVRLALIHYQFEAIHPFLDGNGRIGRLLLILLLSHWQLLPQPLLYLSAYFEQHRQQYYVAHLLFRRRFYPGR
jgi:hypothetical protein